MAHNETDNVDIMEMTVGISPNSDFRMTFDFYTPRAHFIIVKRARARSNEDFSRLDEGEKQEVVNMFIQGVRVLGLEQADFSIHRGKWISSKIFHVHLCTDVEKYCSIFEKLSSRPPMSDWWKSDASRSVVTRQWKINKQPRGYLDNVRGYKKLYKDDIREVRAGKGRQEFQGHRLVYHTNQTRIGVVWSGSMRDAGVVCQLVALLDILAAQLGAQSGSEGCHVVTDLTGRGYDGYEAAAGHTVMGYLQVSANIFLQNCPAQSQAEWRRRYTDRANLANVLT